MPEPGSQERNVVIGEVPHDEAMSRLNREQDLAFDGLSDAVPKFTKVSLYTTFTAEYALIGEDLVFHFFPSPERNKVEFTQYWIHNFPKCLDESARQHFDADYPRLVAKYTDELKSWWFKAHGYDHVIDVDAFVARFLKRLDEAIDRFEATYGSEA